MAGAILALAAALGGTIAVNPGNVLVASLLFPVGLCMLYLLGFDLLTGVFTLAPSAVIARRPGSTWNGVLRNWGLVFVGNFGGALTVALFMAIIFTKGFTQEHNDVGVRIGHIGESRTLGHAAAGFGGMLTLCIRAVMCNWLVSMGLVAALMTEDYAPPDSWALRTAASRIIDATNACLHAQSGYAGAHAADHGYVCTLAWIILKARNAHLFYIRDSRIWRPAGSSLEALTRDHRLALGGCMTIGARVRSPSRWRSQTIWRPAPTRSSTQPLRRGAPTT